ALALFAHRRVEAGVESDRPGWPDNGPNVKVERLQHVVRVATDEVFRGLAIVMPVADGIDLVGVVSHALSIGGTRALLRQRGAEARRAHLDAGAALDRLHHGRKILVRS